MWVQIKVTLFNALVAFILWIGLCAEKHFFRFVFHKTFHFTEEGWHNLSRNAALFFLATAVANEAVRFGFADADIIALNRVFTGIDIWILQDIHRHARDGRVQKHQQPNPFLKGGPRNGVADRTWGTG